MLNPHIVFDPHSLFDRDFDHERQIQLCARHLEILRYDLGEAWWELSPAAAHDDDAALARTPGWTPEQQTLAKHLIRHATESRNFPTTVDFVTHATLEHIIAAKQKQKRIGTGALKKWEVFTHEHMVPGAEVLRILTDRNYAPSQAIRLAPLLGALSWRALITGTKQKRDKGAATYEVGQLEAVYRDSLPPVSQVPGLQVLTDIRQVPPEYYALARYDAAGLLDVLVPTSNRADGLVDRYRAYKTQLAKAPDAALPAETPVG